MIVAILTLSFLLSLLPLVIGTFCHRYVANFYSRGILGLSAVGCVLGLAQFGLLTGTFYKLFPKDLMREAGVWMQYVNIAGGVVMILAGVLWVGFFRALMKARGREEGAIFDGVADRAQNPFVPVGTNGAPSFSEENEAPRSSGYAAEVPVEKVKAPRRRREAADLTGDFFAEEVPVRRVVRMAAVVSRKDGAARRKTGVAGKKG